MSGHPGAVGPGPSHAPPPSTARLLAMAAASLAWAHVLLHRDRHREVLREAMAGRAGPAAAAEVAAATAAAVDRAQRLPGLRASCLPRSLALWRVLCDLGYGSRLRIGVRASRSTVEAHAWVLSGDRVVGDRQDVEDHFQAFSSSEAMPADLRIAVDPAAAFKDRSR